MPVARWSRGHVSDHAREGMVRTAQPPASAVRPIPRLSSLVRSLTHRIARLQKPIDRRHVAFQRTEIVLLVLATEIRQDREDSLVSQALNVISRAPEMMEIVLLLQSRELLEGVLACA